MSEEEEGRTEALDDAKVGSSELEHRPNDEDKDNVKDTAQRMEDQEADNNTASTSPNDTMLPVEDISRVDHHNDDDEENKNEDAADLIADDEPSRAPPQDTPLPAEEDSLEVASNPEVASSCSQESIQEEEKILPDAEVPITRSSSREEIAELQGEVLFDVSMAGKGYTNNWWLKTSATRKLILSGSVTKLVEPRRGFGLGILFAAEQYVGRTLALYKQPDVIFVLRPPKDAAEVRTLLNIPEGLTDDIGEEGFYVAESVIDLNTCKMRLSQLTTPTSLASFDMEKLDNMKRRSCFELSTPSENIILSAVVRPGENGERNFADSAACLETSAWEMAIMTALHAAHAPVHATALHASHETDTAAWKHTIIRGTLHSLVVAGNAENLNRALEVAFAPKEGEKEKNGNARILDERDEFGLTPLMYACTRRLKEAVSILISYGANCTVTTPRDLKTPSHLCAECLDDKSLSMVLSSTRPARPDPNALDIAGRTPMYLASVRGKTVQGGSDASALGRCISALEAWGGQMFVPDPEERPPPIHPIANKSLEWKAGEIDVLFSHINYFYPLNDETASDGKAADNVHSIGQQMHYPLHSALIALRRKIALVEADGLNHGFENLGRGPPLISTLNALLKHGVDVNERLDRVEIRDDDELRDQLNEMVGLTPLQILAAAAIDAETLVSCAETKDGPGAENANDRRLTSAATIGGIMHCIVKSAALLVRSGARICTASPPTRRKKEEKASAAPMTPVKKLSKLSLGGRGSSSVSRASNDSKADVAQEAAPAGVVSSLPLLVDRSALKIDDNEAIMALFGGKDSLMEARSSWLAEPSVRDSKTMVLHVDVPKDGVRGDPNSCAICWKTFGTVTNRRHTCRITKRFVCDECSSKRMYVNGAEHRICDGQYLLAKVEGAMADEEEQIIYDRERERHQEGLKKKKAERSAGPREPEEVDDAKAELFGGAFMKNMKSLITGEEEEEEEDKLQSVTASLSATRDAFNERGERLNSLAEKTAALSDASKDFAAMARELKKQQQSKGLFW